MKIELYIEGENKTFTTPIVPMLAKRKYLEFESRLEKRQKEEGTASTEASLEEIDVMCMILADIVFQNQFTADELLVGASAEYLYQKTAEAVFGIKPKDKEGNDQGK